jgi:hypothetical protein
MMRALVPAMPARAGPVEQRPPSLVTVSDVHEALEAA